MPEPKRHRLPPLGVGSTDAAKALPFIHLILDRLLERVEDDVVAGLVYAAADRWELPVGGEGTRDEFRRAERSVLPAGLEVIVAGDADFLSYLVINRVEHGIASIFKPNGVPWRLGKRDQTMFWGLALKRTSASIMRKAGMLPVAR